MDPEIKALFADLIKAQTQNAQHIDGLIELARKRRNNIVKEMAIPMAVIGWGLVILYWAGVK
jgi:hypothetical protein